MISASIPSPSRSALYLGSVPIHAYALAIIVGIIVAYVILKRRYARQGGPVAALPDIAFWAVLVGIIGARIYHVVTDHQLYFGSGRNPWRAFAIWEGGLGIWGAVLFGALAVWLTARSMGLRLAPLADAIAPALFVAQAIGRLGNYFNQELFGKPTTLPWGLEIDAAHLPVGYAPGTLFHPTFLYEMIWCLLGAAALVWLERRFRLRGGQVFAAYIMIYTAGRCWIENLRIDTANHILGLRLNVWTSIIVFALGLILFIWLTRRLRQHPEMAEVWVSDAARVTFEKKIAEEERREEARKERRHNHRRAKSL